MEWTEAPGVREALVRRLGGGDWTERPIVNPGEIIPAREEASQLPPSSSRTEDDAAPAPRAVIPDDAVPRRVQVELNSDENAEAGWPPQIETRHYILFAGDVVLCDGRGKPSDDAACRQALTPGADAEAIARSLWQRRLSATDFDAPSSALVRRMEGPIF
jgi:hypothetical protein